jgi:hypothetical protein
MAERMAHVGEDARCAARAPRSPASRLAASICLYLRIEQARGNARARDPSLYGACMSAPFSSLFSPFPISIPFCTLSPSTLHCASPPTRITVWSSQHRFAAQKLFDASNFMPQKKGTPAEYSRAHSRAKPSIAALPFVTSARGEKGPAIAGRHGSSRQGLGDGSGTSSTAVLFAVYSPNASCLTPFNTGTRLA